MSFRRTALIATATVAIGASLLAAPLAAASTSLDRGNSDHENQSDNSKRPIASTEPFTIGLWGDQPYGSAGLAALPALVASINAQPLAFTVFDGDIKSGGSLCADSQYTLAKSTFSSILWPTVYTPGDNEWTDCDRDSNGNYVPEERLAHIRQLFFATSNSQGATTMPVEQQDEEFPENARWTKNGITFITINVPGSDNNYPQFDANGLPVDVNKELTSVSHKPQDGSLEEYTERNEANIEWLESSFGWARGHKSTGIMIVQQADMWSTEDPTTHYADEKAALARLVSKTTVPVVLVNGDSHKFGTDNPLNLPNFTRVTTDGSGQHGWTKTTIRPAGPNVFSFEKISTL